MLNLYNLVNLNRRETGGKFQEPSRKKSAGSSFRAVPADFKSHLCTVRIFPFTLRSATVKLYRIPPYHSS